MLAEIGVRKGRFGQFKQPAMLLRRLAENEADVRIATNDLATKSVDSEYVSCVPRAFHAHKIQRFSPHNACDNPARANDSPLRKRSLAGSDSSHCYRVAGHWSGISGNPKIFRSYAIDS